MANYLTTLDLSFPIYKADITIVTQFFIMKFNWDSTNKQAEWNRTLKCF